MNRAFSMLELVFVILVTGIITMVVSTGFQRNNLQEAADQLVSHIRYTEHLALMDDKYVPTPELSPQANSTSKNLETKNWYRGRWQVKFSTAGGSQSYIIMSDSTISNYDGNPNASTNFSYSEVAKDPDNNGKYLIGTAYASFDGGSETHINKKLDLKDTYGIEDISITGGGSGSTANRIIFDRFGRVYRGDTALPNATSVQSPVDKIATSRIYIKLCESACSDPKNSANNDGEIVIAVEPESGYVHIL